MELVFNINEFRKLKKKTGLSMTEFASIIGVSRCQLWRVVNRQCNPGQQFIAGFKRAFPEENLDKFFLLTVLQVNDTSML